MSLTRRAKAAFRHLPGVAHKPPRKAPDMLEERMKANWNTLLVVWPNGTWNIRWGSSTASEMDDVARWTLQEVWNYGELWAAEKRERHQLDAAKFYADDIPADWKPSEKVITRCLREVQHHRSSAFQTYLCARLKTLGRLQP